METKSMHADLRTLLLMLLKLVPIDDERHTVAQQIAKRHGLVELLDDRMGVYIGGDG